MRAESSIKVDRVYGADPGIVIVRHSAMWIFFFAIDFMFSIEKLAHLVIAEMGIGRPATVAAKAIGRHTQ